MSEHPAGTTTEPEFKRVTTTVVTGSATDAPYHVDVKAGTHPLTADEPARRGGSDSGPEPFALLLASLGSCTAITLRMYAERKEWPLDAVRVRLGYETNGARGRITRRVALSGALDEAQRARLLDICERTPVTLALGSVCRLPSSARRAGRAALGCVHRKAEEG
ncbi:OsmC family protein, partial [Kitasatospora sp. NPDC059722]|uniref:OsmC family protein n=1 Tax=Kitasatospora sp. NPDC059722 TaxID=3346925 RepID=UPI0036B62450